MEEMEKLTEQKLRMQRLGGILEKKQPRTKQLSVEIDQQLFNSFKARTSFEGRSLKRVVESLVRRYLEGGGTL